MYNLFCETYNLSLSKIMAPPPLPANEAERLAQLHSYQILDTPAEKDFDDLVDLAAAICGMPVSLISFVADNRQWFKAKTGISETGTGKDISFCAHTVASGQDLIVPDARIDERFLANPLVTGDPHIVFYAGIPLTNSEGFTLGSICVIDNKVRELSTEQHNALRIIARQVMDKLELRRKIMALETANRQIEVLSHEVVLNEQKASYMIKAAPVAIGLLSGKALIIESANDQLLEFWGKSEEVIGKPLSKALPELEGQPFLDILNEVFATGEAHRGTEIPATLHRSFGPETCYFNFVYQPIKDGTGEIRGIMVVANEVTEQVMMRKRSEMNEHRISQLVMTAPVGMTILRGRELVVEIANDPMLKIWTRSREEIVGKRLMDIFPELVDQPFPELLLNIFDDGKGIAVNEIRALISDPHGKMNEIYIDISYEPLVEPDGSVGAIMATVIDITSSVNSRKRLEENENQLLGINQELMLSENRLRMATDMTSLGTFDLDLLTGKLVCNPRCAEIFGFGELDEQTFDHFNERIDPEDFASIVSPAMQAAYKSGDFKYDARLRIPGEPIKWIRVIGKILKEADGKPVRIISTAADVTEQLANDQRKHDFIAIVSHELKTPITSAKAYVQFSARQLLRKKPEPVLDLLDKTLDQLKKMEDMIRGFLDVSRLESGKLHLEMEKFNLADLVRGIILEQDPGTRRHALNLDCKGTAMVYADWKKIAQVVENLLSNAVKYAPMSKVIDIGCRVEDTEVVFSVTDYGPGIKPEDQEKLFERFYRVTNEVSKNIVGFGIGLYLCSEIIQRHHGKISVHSDYGHGATFSFSLPLANESQAG